LIASFNLSYATFVVAAVSTSTGRHIKETTASVNVSECHQTHFNYLV
jgi:hypothetical protein